MHTTDIMNWVAERRTTMYFKHEAILAVSLAYRVLEYMRPDRFFTKPEYPLDPYVQDLIRSRDFDEAAAEIWDQVSRAHEELGSSSGIENLKKCTSQLIARLADS